MLDGGAAIGAGTLQDIPPDLNRVDLGPEREEDVDGEEAAGVIQLADASGPPRLREGILQGRGPPAPPGDRVPEDPHAIPRHRVEV